MKAKNNDEWVPRALREVWEWKDSIYQDTKHLPTREAFREIMRMAHEAAVAQGAAPATPAKVTETSTPYRTKRTRKTTA